MPVSENLESATRLETPLDGSTDQPTPTAGHSCHAEKP